MSGLSVVAPLHFQIVIDAEPITDHDITACKYGMLSQNYHMEKCIASIHIKANIVHVAIAILHS